MPGDDALRFAERLLALLEATRYSATYKLATLLALIDVVGERTGADGSVPERISGKEVGRRVIELYWPQTVPYGAAADGQPRVLRQAPQNDIPAKLAAWRRAHRLGADPAGWAALEAELVAIVIGMPLAKLQRFGEQRRSVEDRFIYDFSWRDHVLTDAGRGHNDAFGLAFRPLAVAAAREFLFQDRDVEFLLAQQGQLAALFKAQEIRQSVRANAFRASGVQQNPIHMAESGWVFPEHGTCQHIPPGAM